MFTVVCCVSSALARCAAVAPEAYLNARTLVSPTVRPMSQAGWPSSQTDRPIRVLVVRTLVKRLTLAPIHVSHPKIQGALVYRRPRLSSSCRVQSPTSACV